MTLNKNQLNCLPLPEWVNDLLVSFGGVRNLNTVSLDSITTTVLDTLIVYENDLLTHKQILLDHVKKGQIKSLIIFNGHMFLFSEALLRELNELGKKFDIHIMAQGYYAMPYPYIQIHNYELEEHCIGHHFNLLLTNKLKKLKKTDTEKTFLLQIVAKDDFRKTIVNSITNSSIKDDILQPPSRSSNELYSMHDDLINTLKKVYNDRNDVIDAIKSFGNGTPNMKLYQNSFCELVAETVNDESKPYMFTEKVFRPIALGVPIIFLGSKSMYMTLKKYGYKFYDNDFYVKWHDINTDLTERCDMLLSFMKHIQQDIGAKENMQSIANSNLVNFWNNRKLDYYANWHNIFDIICRDKHIERVVDDVYERLNF